MINVLVMLFVSVITLLSRITQQSDSLQENIPELSPQKACPSCHSHNLIKNGSIHNGKPKSQCKDCGRQFVDNPNNIVISLQIKQLIDKLLLERISLRGIARVTGVSWSWLQDYVNSIMAHTPRHIKIAGKLTGHLTIECDEMWSFVDSKKNEVYAWLAIERDSRIIVGCFIGDRTRKSAHKLWASLPPIYQQCAVAYTDFWQAYNTVIPHERHRAVGKESGQTNHVERLNNTFRQRVSRLVRKSLSFSKNLNNHIGAIWYFIHGYNAELERV